MTNQENNKQNPRPVKTPCVGVCYIDPKINLCLGCYRSLEEIAKWSKMSDEKREEIMSELLARK